jgi:hypothetical protein
LIKKLSDIELKIFKRDKKLKELGL